MKKTTTLLFGLFFTTFICLADGGWASSAVSLIVDNDTSDYKLNDEGWTDGTWQDSALFESYNLGTPTRFILNGGAGNAWTNDSPGYDSSSFILYYRVYLSGSTPGNWMLLNLDNETYNNGNNRIFSKVDADIDLLALATEDGENDYVLELAMSKNQSWGEGSWNSMVPGGQETAYDVGSDGYMAVFTVNNVTTELPQTFISDFDVRSYNKHLTLDIQSEQIQEASITLVNLAGQATPIYKTQLINGSNTIDFPYQTTSGIYVLKAQIGNTRLVRKIAIQ